MSAATATTFPVHYPSASYLRPTNHTLRSSFSARNLYSLVTRRPAKLLLAAKAGSRANDSAPSGMSVEYTLKLLGVPETAASFDEILRAKNSIVATCEDDEDAVAQVEAAYDMLLMQSLAKRQAGEVVSSKNSLC